MIVVECDSVPAVAVTVIMLVPAGVPPDALDFPPPQPAGAKTDSRIATRPPARTSAVRPKRDRSVPKYSPARRSAPNPTASNIRNCDVGHWLDAGPDGTPPVIPLRGVVVIMSMGVVVPPGV